MADGSCILSSQGRARHAPDEEVMQRSGNGYAAMHVGIDGMIQPLGYSRWARVLGRQAGVASGNRLRRGS